MGQAQEVITAKDYSGFMRGNGYGWPTYASPTNLGQIRAARTESGSALNWDAAGLLQVAAELTGPWADVAGASSPHIIAPAPTNAFYRVRGSAAVHSGVGAGCPQQGFDFTGLPTNHWANRLASPNACGWIVPESWTGFADVGMAQDAYVQVVMRSFNVDNGWTWWNGPSATPEDDAIHQNDGWFHFRVRNPTPLGPLAEYRLRFEVCFDNPYAFPGDPLQLNLWWADGTWDWEDHGGRHIYTPMYRIKSPTGTVGPWRHITETNVHPVAGCLSDQRHYRCLFEETIPRTNWVEIEVAQNLPYTIDDRRRLLEHVRTNHLHRYDDLGIRKKHLGYGGLYSPPGETQNPHAEFNELYAIEIFRQTPGSDGVPDLPNDRIVVVLAGLDYEPAGNFVAEGVLLEILDHWATADRDYRNRASYVILPIANPDGYEWGTCHVVPYGNGYGGATNVIHRGYMFLEPEAQAPDPALDPEALALRDYFRSLTAQGLDGHGGSIVTLLDLQNDLCPHPGRWQDKNWFLPPIYGIIKYGDAGQSNAALRVLSNLRVELTHPNTGRYVRDSSSPQGWEKQPYAGYGIPLWILFEFDAAVLYSHVTGPPGGWLGQFPTPIRLLGTGGDPTFYVHGHIDQIGLATAGDPAHVFKLFGRDIIDAVRAELLPP